MLVLGFQFSKRRQGGKENSKWERLSSMETAPPHPSHLAYIPIDPRSASVFWCARSLRNASYPEAPALLWYRSVCGLQPICPKRKEHGAWNHCAFLSSRSISAGVLYVCACFCVHVRVRGCTCMWRAEVKLACHSSGAIHLACTDPELAEDVRVSGQWTQVNLISMTISTHIHTRLFGWALDIKCICSREYTLYRWRSDLSSPTVPRPFCDWLRY